MRRLLLPLAFTFQLALGSGDVSLGEKESCSETCPDDGPDRSCPPGCSFCACCAHARPVLMSAEPTPHLPVVGSAVPELKRAPPAAPEPRDILHVPKVVLA